MDKNKFKITVDMDLYSYTRFIAMHNLLGFQNYSETIHYLIEHANLPESKVDMFKHEYKRLRTKVEVDVDDG